jgi:hypothetical protein
MLADTAVDSATRAHAREASSNKPVDVRRDRNAATGRFLPGNSAWEARRPAGPAPKFADAESLWEACVQYFDWVNEHPLYAVQLVTYKGRTTQVPVRKVRAMTKGDLCRFLGIQRRTWNGWKRDRPDLELTVEKAEDVIWIWQFEHAAVGLLDAGVVIRQLGLANKTVQREPDQ